VWKAYDDNFSKIYPDVQLRKKDIKLRCYYYRLDIPKILIGKTTELFFYDNNLKKFSINGEISDVWTRYSVGGLVSKWQYKFKIDGKWHIVKNNDVKIYDTKDKTELERTLDLFISTKKFNL
jgi:hypothetical protein